jgi:phage-related protein
MAQTQTLQVKIDAAINAEATLKTLRELKQLQKETVAGSADYKKIQARINDIGDAAKTAKGQSEDWIDALAGAGGPIGMLGRGLDTITSSTNKFGLALKATGIGLIVALVGQLVAAFTSNEKAMKKLEPIMIGFEQILGGIFAVLEPVFDLFIDLAMKAMPYLQKAIGGLYTAFAALFSFFKNFIGTSIKLFSSFGKVLKGVFTLDWDLLKEGVSDSVSVVDMSVSCK